MVAAEQNLRGRHQTCECGNRSSIGRTRNIVIKALELILDAVDLMDPSVSLSTLPLLRFRPVFPRRRNEKGKGWPQ
jgi:hypothetical protein